MAEAIRVVYTSRSRRWRVEKLDGTYCCDIRLNVCTTSYTSEYLVLQDGSLYDRGRFVFDVLSDQAVRDVLRDVVAAVVRKHYPHAKVIFEARALPDLRATCLSLCAAITNTGRCFMAVVRAAAVELRRAQRRLRPRGGHRTPHRQGAP
jgi:hypothetical protein